MSLAGMANASRLRAASGVRHDVAIRLRPDGRMPWWDASGQVEWNALSLSWIARMWNCIALFAQSLTAWTRRAGGVDTRGAFESLLGHPPVVLDVRQNTSAYVPDSASFKPRRALMACGPRNRGFNGGLNEDQCFFGTPEALDAVLIDQFMTNYANVYADVRRGANEEDKFAMRSRVSPLTGPSHAMGSADYWQHQELQFVHALKLAGIQRAHTCWGDAVQWDYGK
eukprot:5424061-Prymnesium_polylepis.2